MTGEQRKQRNQKPQKQRECGIESNQWKENIRFRRQEGTVAQSFQRTKVIQESMNHQMRGPENFDPRVLRNKKDRNPGYEESCKGWS